MEQKTNYRLIFLLGPTAVGKTQLSFYLAKKLKASILNCDSIAMYKGLNIGSAKPLSQIQNPEVPLFLFDEWSPPFICTAGEFRTKALKILKHTLPRHPALVVGGSGFYMQALEKGMYPIKKIAPSIKQQVQKTYKEKGLSGLYKQLTLLDPEYVKQISNQDQYRIKRALCIVLSEKKTMNQIQKQFKNQHKALPWPLVKIGLYLRREVLQKKIQIRTEKMITNGILDETKDLLNKGLANWPLMKSAGYHECVLCLKGELPKSELKQRIVIRTMQVAKKQMSWFKRDKSILWYLSEEKNWPKIYELLLKKDLTAS